jgi:molybdate transport system ATP-binding protein
MRLTLDIPVNKNNWQAHYICDVKGANVIGIVGRSGSGKSTLLRMIAGLEPSKMGHISIDETIWLAQGQSVKPQQRNIAYVTQHNLLFPHLTIGKNLQLAAKNGRLSAREHAELLTRLGISLWLDKKPQQLSGGQRQKVALAQGMLQTPTLLLLDEPLSALDSHARNELINILGDYQKKFLVPMIYVSHSNDEIVALADHCLVIDNGVIVANDSTPRIFPSLKTRQNMAHEAQGSVLMFQALHWHQDDEIMQLNLLKPDHSPSNQMLWVPMPANMLGQRVTMQILAQDIILSRHHITDSSLQNVLTASVQDLDHGNAECTLSLEIDGNCVFSVISLRAQNMLKFTRGDRVYAHVKSMSLQFGRDGLD